MSTNAPDTSSAQLVPAAAGAVDRIDTPVLIVAMLESGQGISDLIFSPGRPPQVEQHGELTAVVVPGLPLLVPDDTARIARDLIGSGCARCTNGTQVLRMVVRKRAFSGLCLPNRDSRLRDET